MKFTARRRAAWHFASIHSRVSGRNAFLPSSSILSWPAWRRVAAAATRSCARLQRQLAPPLRQIDKSVHCASPGALDAVEASGQNIVSVPNFSHSLQTTHDPARSCGTPETGRVWNEDPARGSTNAGRHSHKASASDRVWQTAVSLNRSEATRGSLSVLP